MHHPRNRELKAIATTVEEFMRHRGGGGGGNEPPEDEPTALGKKIRDYAERLIHTEEDGIMKESSRSLSNWTENMLRLKDLRNKFKLVSDPAFSGAVEAVKVIVNHHILGTAAPQPAQG